MLWRFNSWTQDRCSISVLASSTERSTPLPVACPTGGRNVIHVFLQTKHVTYVSFFLIHTLPNNFCDSHRLIPSLQVELEVRGGCVRIPEQFQQGFLQPVIDWLRGQQEAEGESSEFPLFDFPDPCLIKHFGEKGHAIVYKKNQGLRGQILNLASLRSSKVNLHIKFILFSLRVNVCYRMQLRTVLMLDVS